MLGKLPRYARFASSVASDSREVKMQAHFPEATPLAEFADHAVWQMPRTCKLKGTPLFESGELAGMDLGSIVATMCLDVGATDTVLEICCAPGSKLQLISEMTTGHVTGVDIDLYRLSVTRSCLQKYKHNTSQHIRLVLADGTTYDPTAVQSPWWSGPHSLLSVNPSRHKKRLAASYPNLPEDVPLAGIVLADYASEMSRGKKRKHEDEGVVITEYDRVLVDAECTTDGSLRHVEKLIESGQAWGERSGWGSRGANGAAELFTLQTALLARGVALCKPGGVIVYSTCSLSAQQNEDVVSELLRRGDVEAIDAFDNTHTMMSSDPQVRRSETLPCTAYCQPTVTNCGTIFIAKLRKKENVSNGPIKCTPQLTPEAEEESAKRPRI